jgi:hypothetical protein
LGAFFRPPDFSQQLFSLPPCPFHAVAHGNCPRLPTRLPTRSQREDTGRRSRVRN